MNINYDSNNFKSGDHVICIIPDKGEYLIMNNNYTIKTISNNFCDVANNTSLPLFFLCRFKLDELYYRKKKLIEIQEFSK